jgi:tyrosyl-tRNA synthetase
MSKKKPFEGTITYAIEEHMRQRNLKKRRNRLNKIREAYEAVLNSMWHGDIDSLDYLVRLARKAK